ncbi:PAS domain S-box protein [Bacillus cereus group sp. IBL03679]|uniref:PAS domain-containing sensor histidine kinase n=1 Tax=Bacillus cereus group sp. IBL03679 TaxID=3240095 RepID=UPI003D2F846B
MIIKEIFINITILSFLASVAVFVHIFTLKLSRFSKKFYGGVTAVTLMFFSFEYMGIFYDLRFVPLILSFVYFGCTAGWITLVSITLMQFLYFSGDLKLQVVFFLGIGILFTLSNIYIKNFHPYKISFLYLAVCIGVTGLIDKLLLPVTTKIFYIPSLLFISIGLLIGILFIEAYRKLYYFIKNLLKINLKLEKARGELKDTVHEIQGGIFKFKKINKHFIYTMCDGQFFHQNGFDPRQMVGKSLCTIDSSIIPSHIVPQLLKYYIRAWEGQEVKFEIPWLNDKTIILIVLRPIRKNGRVVEVVGSLADITDRKGMELELRSTKERLESFVNHNVDAIVFSNREGYIFHTNNAYEKIFGWSTQEILGKKLPCIPNFLLDESLTIIEEILSEKSTNIRLDTVRQRKDGSLVDVNLIISPIRDMEGNIIALSIIYRDISEKKQVEREQNRLHKQLKESELKYRALLEQATDAVYLVELSKDQLPTRIIEVNPAGCKRFNSSRSELLSMPFLDIVSQESQFYKTLIQKIQAGKRSFTFQEDYEFNTKKKITTEFSIRIFKLNGKDVFLGISRDITERLKTEELLRKSEKLALVGQLAPAIAHEIRNPLTVMKGFMDLFKLKDNQNNQRYIDIVSAEIDRMESITNEFMALAKPQAIKTQPNNISALIEQVIILLQPQATLHDIYIRIDLAPDIPKILCEGNQLKQVFVNILKNSIESMQNGGEILIQTRKQEDNQISILFIDEGCGIPKDRMPYLAEPFYSIKEGGVGLGLMVCYKIIETHQGKIHIESEVNKGTSIKITLPISTSEH